MVGNLINKSLKLGLAFIFALCCCYSCNEVCEKHNIDSAIYSYVDYFKTLEYLKPRDYIVKVTVDSTNTEFIGYRINTSPVLLNSNEFPNIIDEYSNFKIAFFTKKIIGKGQIQKMQESLKIENYYAQDRIMMDANYPEWVLLKSKKSQCTHLIKNAGFEEIDVLVDNLK